MSIEDQKVEAAVKSIQEFEAMLNGIRQQAWDEGYAAAKAEFADDGK